MELELAIEAENEDEALRILYALLQEAGVEDRVDRITLDRVEYREIEEN